MRIEATASHPAGEILLKESPRELFRTKPREIEAVQFHGVGHYEARGLQYPEGVCFCEQGKQTSASASAHVHTAHNQAVVLAVGDWISPEPDGRGFYPIKPDIFDTRYELSPTPDAQPSSESDEITDDQIKHMVDRFLSWKLPENFNPDNGISFKPTFNDHLPEPMKHNPVGTNLLDAMQAEAMVRHMIAGLSQPSSTEGEVERVARAIAARKMGLLKDVHGERLPDDLWRQCLPEARADADVERLREALETASKRLNTLAGVRWAAEKFDPYDLPEVATLRAWAADAAIAAQVTKP